MMHVLLAILVGVLTSTGLYLMLRRHSFDVILGLSVLSYAVNLFIFLMGRVHTNKAPIVTRAGADMQHYADPLPQALVLTAIVISFAMTAVLIAIAIRSFQQRREDTVNAPTNPGTPDQDTIATTIAQDTVL